MRGLDIIKTSEAGGSSQRVKAGAGGAGLTGAKPGKFARFLAAGEGRGWGCGKQWSF